jgi:molybdopterin-guanine dinucleotide biosynthesis protein A
MKSVIILCGGRSTRMGKDKGSFLLKGEPMILYILSVVKEVADEIIVVLRDEKQVRDYSDILKDTNDILKIVTDKSIDHGPLMGILTGLANIKSDKAQILPCDSPYISKEFLLKMFKIMEDFDFDAAVPIWDDGHTEPLHSIYKKNSLNIIEKLIHNGKRNVNSLITSLNVKFVDVEKLDPTCQSFQNINTIKDIDSLK